MYYVFGQLCEDSVDFKRPIFNAPLSDCEFHEQTINTAWSASSLPMTPLFSQSQSFLQGSQDSSLSQAVLSSQDGNATLLPREAHLIRATFTSTQTQTQTQTQDTMASSTQASQASALFAMSGRPTRTQREGATQDSTMTVDDSAVPRRRIPQANAARAQIIRGVMNANRRREARAAQQATERGNKVQMMRRYRIGKGTAIHRYNV